MEEDTSQVPEKKPRMSMEETLAALEPEPPATDWIVSLHYEGGSRAEALDSMGAFGYLTREQALRVCDELNNFMDSGPTELSECVAVPVHVEGLASLPQAMDADGNLGTDVGNWAMRCWQEVYGGGIPD